MQITIAIKGALSSVTVHLFASLWWQVVATKGALVCLTYVASGSVAKRFPKAFHIFTCITIIENGAHLYGKVNEEEKGEDADDTKPIFRVHLEEQEMRRDMEVKKIIVKTRTTGSGSRMTRSRSRTARSRSIEHRRYAVPRGSQFCKSGLGILRKGEVIP
ncbi:hypothetical protein T4A_7735 [Trichinella pseudospiralis]|uniref:Uncharacterized protein n=2 Tax=Trichinella pseudospiralis TaxID=6337 RepID=A0A0V1EDD7_TRIPS|nr:hypothetical protein T4A_7735 [Trichinella pseudospiralis]